MIVFPNAKINLGLNILSRRSDGYHNISTCLYPIPFSDVLEIIPAEKLSFSSSGIAIPGTPAENLCIKAYEIISKDFGIPPVSIHLHKIIPIGAGLGGGSSNASYTLQCLNKLFSLSISNQQLETYAAELGSDCPFFIKNKAAIATGTGTDFSETAIDLSGLFMVLVYPDIHIPTVEAYTLINPSFPELNIAEILKKNVNEWQGLLINDFEKPIFDKHTSLEVFKDQLTEAGAVYVSMTGSGSAIYGLFPNEVKFNLPEVVWSGWV